MWVCKRCLSCSIVILLFLESVVLLVLSWHHASVRYEAELLLTACSSCATNAHIRLIVIVLLIVVLLISAVLLFKLSHEQPSKLFIFTTLLFLLFSWHFLLHLVLVEEGWFWLQGLLHALLWLLYFFSVLLLGVTCGSYLALFCSTLGSKADCKLPICVCVTLDGALSQRLERPWNLLDCCKVKNSGALLRLPYRLLETPQLIEENVSGVRDKFCLYSWDWVDHWVIIAVPLACYTVFGECYVVAEVQVTVVVDYTAQVIDQAATLTLERRTFWVQNMRWHV